MSFGNKYRGKSVFITGHTGFKGSWLTSWLLELGAQITGYSKDIPTTPAMFQEVGLEDRITHIVGDVRDYEALHAAVVKCKPDFIFHMAAQPIVSESYRNPLETISSNALGTATLCEAVRQYGQPCNLVIVTSDKCYENQGWEWGYRESDQIGGRDIYSASKGAAEVLAHSYYQSFFHDSPIRIVTARAGNVIGGGDWGRDRIIVDCVHAWQNKKKVEVRRPSATRPWQHVMEPLSGYLSLGLAVSENPKLNGESFNFGPPSDQEVTVLQLLEELSSRFGFDDAKDAYYLNTDPSFSEARTLKLNCDRALVVLHWVPNLVLSKTIQMTADWYRSYWDGGNMREMTLKQIQEYTTLAKEKNYQWTQ